MTWFLDLRAQSTGGGLADSVAIYNQDVLSSVADLTQEIGGRDILVVTHGFNVNRQDGRTALSLWQQMLPPPATVAYLGLLWPGDSSWLHGLDYPVEGSEAMDSGDKLASFLLQNFPSASLSLVSHSLGARVMLQALRGIGNGMRVKHLMLMAGAIDDTCLNDEYGDAVKYVEKISVLSSSNDEVLSLAFPLGNLVQGILLRGSPYMKTALGRDGPQTPFPGAVQPGWQIPGAWKYGHHNYLPSTPCAKLLSLPQPFPTLTDPVPAWANFIEWQQAWSAAMLCSRFWPDEHRP